MAELSGVSAKTIRYYESIGVLPEPSRTAGGYRDYVSQDLERLRFVRDAQATGLSLPEIRLVVEFRDGGRPCEKVRRLLIEHIRAIDDRLSTLRRSRRDFSALAERASHLGPAG